jgi:hypothetical protein
VITGESKNESAYESWYVLATEIITKPEGGYPAEYK